MIIESPAFGISMGVVAFSMCVGFFLCLVRRGVHLVNALKALFSKPTTILTRAADPAKEAVSTKETVPTSEAVPAKEKE
jgi:TRAP-type C4-dicarboxylate transport system permease small subunit